MCLLAIRESGRSGCSTPRTGTGREHVVFVFVFSAGIRALAACVVLGTELGVVGRHICTCVGVGVGAWRSTVDVVSMYAPYGTLTISGYPRLHTYTYTYTYTARGRVLQFR